MNKFSQLLSFFILLTFVTPAVAQVNWSEPDTLFYAPDTVCVDQPVNLSSRYANQSSYYWGFCSGYLANTPTGSNMGAAFQLHHPDAIDVKLDKTTGNYYGFVLNTSTTELIRLNFGKSLNNVPTVTNFGNLTNGLPVNPTSMYIVEDTMAHNWFMFVTGGFTAATSTVARIDFGPTLSNPAPNIANFGNLWNSFNRPRGIFVAQDGVNHQWYGYVLNYNTNTLLRMDFSYNISNTPAHVYNLGNPTGLLNDPTDMAGIYYGGKWYFFVTNAGTSTIVRLDVGTVLNPAVIGAADIGNFDYRILVPSSISINADCGGLYAYIADSTSDQLIDLEMVTPTGPYNAVDFASVGSTNLPSCVSSIIRDQDQVFAFITNVGDSSISKIFLQQCTNSSIPSFNEQTPPQYFYDSPGVYNIYYVINEGLPTVQVACKPIYVLAKPAAFISPDKSICHGDTTRLWAVSIPADSIIWSNIYHADTTFLRRDSMKVWPAYNSMYPVTLYYPHGCIVKDTVNVSVTQISADAGPDRTITDGASTTLGGPLSSSYGVVSYYWQPYQFMANGDTLLPNPVVNPPYDYSYWVTVTELNDSLYCTATDTVNVHVSCGDFVVSNVFAPNSPYSVVNGFGILNNEIASLAYLRIYDRWGLLVFETTDASQRWDGTFGGTPQPVGVYVWEADGYCTNGKHVTKKGNVTLIR
jgi:gliding motility-associated-like protein